MKIDREQKCPQCGGPVERVRQSADSPFNRDQFDAAKAGDCYCPTCPGNGRGHSGLCYWWDHELPAVHTYQI